MPNHSPYKKWDRTANGAIIPFSVNLSDHFQKNPPHKKILTRFSGTWTYGSTDLAVFVPLVTHVPCKNSILLQFSTPGTHHISPVFWGTNQIRIEGGLLISRFKHFSFHMDNTTSFCEMCWKGSKGATEFNNILFFCHRGSLSKYHKLENSYRQLFCFSCVWLLHSFQKILGVR